MSHAVSDLLEQRAAILEGQHVHDDPHQEMLNMMDYNTWFACAVARAHGQILGQDDGVSIGEEANRAMLWALAELHPEAFKNNFWTQQMGDGSFRRSLVPVGPEVLTSWNDGEDHDEETGAPTSAVLAVIDRALIVAKECFGE